MKFHIDGLLIDPIGTSLGASTPKAAFLECKMDRFDPNSHPDRFVFEAQARQIRAEEIDRFFHATASWMACQEHRLAQRLAQLGHSVLHHQPLGHS